MRRNLVLGTFGLMLWAGAATPAEAPLPPPRPEGLGTEAQASAGEVPLPPARPHGLEDEHPTPASPAPIAGASPAGSGDGEACLARLETLGVRAEPAPAIENGACGAPHPIRLIGLPDGLDVSPPAIVTCPVAEALAKWAVEAVSEEAGRHLASAPTKILIGTSYECRGRNRQAGAKLSEHAFANAVDVMGFEFHKRPAVAIRPRGDESPEALFQAAVRQRACAYFTTVLGPGSDAAHADHLHLDMRSRRGGGRMCQ